MSEILQCEKCVDEKAALGQPITADEFQLSMDAESTTWQCEKGHTFSTPEIEAIMASMTPASTKSKKQVKSSHKQDTATTPKSLKNNDIKDVEQSHQNGNASDSDIQKVPAQAIKSVADINDHGVILANGDLSVYVAIQEPYVNYAQELAAEDGISIAEWLQRRLDFYLESDFAPTKVV